jgi:hypothetical protein
LKRYPSTATRTVGSIWTNRSSTARVPKSGAQEDHTAPIEAAPRNATIASGTFGR